MRSFMELPVSGKSNRPLVWILTLMAGGLVVLGTFIYKTVESPAPQSELDKYTEVVTQENLTPEIKSSGVVEPIQSVNISPKESGRVARLLVEQGMRVKKGQPLAVMENRKDIFYQGQETQANLSQSVAAFEEAKVRIPEEIRQAKARLFQAQAQVNQIQAQIAQAQANLNQAQARIPKDITQAQAQLGSAQSRLQLALDRVERNKPLVEQGAITEDQFKELWNNYLDAAAKVAESQERLEQFQKTQNPEIEQLQAQIVQLQQRLKELQGKVAEYQFAVEQREKTAKLELDRLKSAAQAAQAQLKQVEIKFGDTVVTAPFDGIVTQKYATEGAFVTPTTSASSTASATSASILALAQGLEVVAKVPEVDLSLIKMGQPVNIVADAFPNEVFQGRVIRIAPEAVIEQNVTSFEVTIGLVTGQDKLLSKMNVDVTFIGQELSNILVVPTVAIVTEKGETGVMIPDEENKPKFQPVTIGLVLDDKTQILSGLKPGQRVFVDLPEEKNKSKKEQSQSKKT